MGLRKKNEYNRKRNMLNLNQDVYILNPESSFEVYEAYKSARTSLLALTENRDSSIIAVTSAVPGEGKTVTTINLAISMMQSGKKVLIIDADLRASKVSKYLKIAAGKGLSDYLRGENSEIIRYSLKQMGGDIYILSAGSAVDNPAELLMKKQMGTLLDKLKQKYDYIFIDTPPVNVVTDALVIHRWVTGYLLVVRAGVSNIDAVRSMVMELEKVNAESLGFFVHDIDINGERYGKRYKYSKYGQYREYK